MLSNRRKSLAGSVFSLKLLEDELIARPSSSIVMLMFSSSKDLAISYSFFAGAVAEKLSSFSLIVVSDVS